VILSYYYNNLINNNLITSYNYNMLQNNGIYMNNSLKNLCAKRVLVIIEPFLSIKGSLELSKEPYASYRTPMDPFF